MISKIPNEELYKSYLNIKLTKIRSIKVVENITSLGVSYISGSTRNKSEKILGNDLIRSDVDRNDWKHDSGPTGWSG